jgi:DUF2911 family protein
MHVRIGLIAAALALGAIASAQAAAPRDTATASVSGKKVAVEYGRPSLKGRSLDELTKGLPADRIWRAGSEQVTTLVTETPLMVGGKKVAPGKYSVYVYAPEEGDWALVLNSDEGIALIKLWDKAPANLASAPWPHLEGYSNILAKEVARAPMKAGTTAPPAEMFTIGLAANKTGGATLLLSWGDKSWSLDLQPAK